MVERKKTVTELYFSWLSTKVSAAQFNELYLCYHDIDEFCRKIKILEQPLFETTDLMVIKSVQKTVTENRIFQLQHKKHMKRIVSAAQYYTDFIREFGEKAVSKKQDDSAQFVVKESSITETVKICQNDHVTLSAMLKSVTHPIKEENYGDISDYKQVLEERFVKGFRLGSALELKKFKRYYAELNDKEISQDDAEIEKIIRSCGIVHEEKLFMPKAMLSDDLKQKLLDYISGSFASGKTSIYYEALFTEFSEEFLDHYIYDAEMLKAYLMYLDDGSYHIGKNQITKEAGTTSDPIDEVRSCLKDYGRPMETDRLCEILSHLPRNNVTAILGGNLEFVRNSKGEYFHADVMALSEEELDNIADIIDGAIRIHNFISGTELLKAIKTKYPYTYETYSSYSDIAWRDALKYKFGDRFSFKGNIISAPNATLSMTDVFGDLAANAEQLSMDELFSFSKEMGTVIYFDPVYENAIRVSEDLFVSKSHAKFKVKETDNILDRFVTGSYLPLQEVRVFGIFPDAGFTWNIYLLESYVTSYSEKYALIHGGYNRNCAVGAIVKRAAGYKDLDILVVDVLADSGIDLNKTNALEYLAKNGYIARRTYSGIEGLLIRANAKRKTGRRM